MAVMYRNNISLEFIEIFEVISVKKNMVEVGLIKAMRLKSIRVVSRLALFIIYKNYFFVVVPFSYRYNMLTLYKAGYSAWHLFAIGLYC